MSRRPISKLNQPHRSYIALKLVPSAPKEKKSWPGKIRERNWNDLLGKILSDKSFTKECRVFL